MVAVLDAGEKYSSFSPKYKGIYGSSSHALSDADGFITTDEDDLVILITNANGDAKTAGTMVLEAQTDCDINFDDDLEYIRFMAGDKVSWDGIAFSSIRVATTGSVLRFIGLTV